MTVDVTKIYAYIAKRSTKIKTATTTATHHFTTNTTWTTTNVTTTIAKFTTQHGSKIANVNSAYIVNLDNLTKNEIQIYQKLHKQKHRKHNMQHQLNKIYNSIMINKSPITIQINTTYSNNFTQQLHMQTTIYLHIDTTYIVMLILRAGCYGKLAVSIGLSRLAIYNVII